MNNLRSRITLLVLRLLVVIVLYTLIRIAFFLTYKELFIDVNSKDIFFSFMVGILYDLSIISISNLVFIFLSLIPSEIFLKKWQHITVKYIYIITNSVFLFFNCVDIAYFRFTNRRSTSDIFNQIFGGQTDILAQIPDYLSDFWPVILIYSLVVISLFLAWSKSKLIEEKKLNQSTKKNNLKYGLSLFIFSGFCFTFINECLGLNPIEITDAGKFVSNKTIPLVLNSPFTILRSLESDELENPLLTPISSAIEYIEPEKNSQEKKFLSKNIVVLILEGFSKEYTALGKKSSITPFLDSLMKHSLVFTNAWSNGKQSIEGVPAVLSGIPSLLGNPYINSKFSNNKTNSFAQLLKRKGYTTAFFHGGKNGTMNFDRYAKIAGFDSYFGMREYNKYSDFDGNWGIWDESYLKYCAKEFSKFKTPFLASIFTLSSHHPFNIPKKYEGKFPIKDIESAESVGYADYSLRKFFDSAKKQDWYANTWFIIVADHTGISNDAFFSNTVGQHSIPIILYSADGNFQGNSNNLIQQIDIIPTLMDTLGYNLPFFSFGKSAFNEKKNHFAVYLENGNYFLTNDSMCYTFNNHKITEVYNFLRDSTLSKNVLKEINSLEAENYYRNFIQLYFQTLIENKTFAK